jgi:hypothetical protein
MLARGLRIAQTSLQRIAEYTRAGRTCWRAGLRLKTDWQSAGSDQNILDSSRCYDSRFA